MNGERLLQNQVDIHLDCEEERDWHDGDSCQTHPIYQRTCANLRGAKVLQIDSVGATSFKIGTMFPGSDRSEA
jgi:hypothetical protein